MRATLRCLQAAIHQHAPRPKGISFIGLGRMGSEMAFNLFSKRHAEASDAHFVVCDAVPDSARSFCDNFRHQFPGAKITIAETPYDAVLASGIVVTMLPSSPQVKEVYGGAYGVIRTLKSAPDLAESTLCIDSTTLDVDVARQVASSVLETGAQIIDAPVSGGVTGAKAGTLSFLVGGTKAAFELSTPILATMGKRFFHCGPSGAGLGAKICNNLILGVEQIIVAEAMLLGQRLGIDPAVLASVINSSTGACWSSSVNNPVPSALPEKSPPCERDYEGGFATTLMLKDMGLATNMAASFDSPLPLGEAAEKLYAHVLAEQPDLARKDFSAVYRFLHNVAEEGKRVRLGEVESS